VTFNRLLGVRRASWARALFAAAACVLVVLSCTPPYTFVPDNQVVHCGNGMLDSEQGETDIDCGGPDCHGCGLGKICTVPSDCSDGECLSGSCQMPGCANGVQDSSETDIDCGGDCPGCSDGDSCSVGSDCLSNVCNPHQHCASATCSDGVLNGDETARDCGGPVCDLCPAGSPCKQGSDCKSGECDADTKTCVLVCAKNTENCDDNPTDCEANLLTSSDNCGACGMTCDIANAKTSCVGGECQIDSCVDPYARCNADDTGCSTDLSGDVANCGACGMECPQVNGTASCKKGVCVVDCTDSAFGDCDGDPSNGCEASLTDVENCGSCGHRCDNVDGKQAFCKDGRCGATNCETNFGDCDGDMKTCEVDLANDPNNCGRCGNVCTVVHGTPGCQDGNCVVSSCDDGFDNCNSGASDGGYSDGCEANLNDSMDNCGSCKTQCNVANGTGTCDSGACAVVSCNTGFKNCDEDAADHGASNGCETDTTSDPHSCGGCGNECMATNASSDCVASQCTVGQCDGNYGDCDGDPTNGCETDVSGSIQHCGSCKGTCSKAGALSATCTNGKCDPPTCDASHQDCDGNPANGCETDITLSANCGRCGHACDAADTCLNISGKYGCQSSIVYVNDVEGNASGTTLNVTHSLVSKTKRFLLASIVMESTQAGRLGTPTTPVTPTAVTYAGLPMTAGPHQAGETGAQNPYLFYYYLADTGQLPASGNQTLHVTGDANGVQLIAANLMEFSGVDPSVPPVSGTEKIVTNIGATCTATGAITTVRPGTVLFALSSAHYAGTATATGQLMMTPSWTATVDNQLLIYSTYGGTDTRLAAGTYTIGFTYGWCNPAVNLPLGVVPFRQE
jgi:hypothetical protein